MVLKRLNYKFDGYKVPWPHVPKSAKRKRSARKQKVDNKTCAIDLLAAIAGKLLLEGEGSLGPRTNIGVCNPCNLNIKQEHAHAENTFKSCTESTVGSNAFFQREVISNVPKLLSTTLATSPIIMKSDSYSRDVHAKKHTLNGNCETITLRNNSDPSSLEDVDAKLLPFVSSGSNVKVPLPCNGILHSRASPKYREEKLAVNRDDDDDENSSGCCQPSFTSNKVLNPRGLGERRIRKQLATKVWKVAPIMMEAGKLSNADVDTKSNFFKRKICYSRQRTQTSLFKRRKFFQRCSVVTSVRQNKDLLSAVNMVSSRTSYEPEDFHDTIVKLSIKSFKVPEVFIDIPETATVASLKGMVMEAVTAILGGGLHVGVVVHGNKVRDDSKTLLQAGISHGDKLDNLTFTLEPNPNQAPATLASPEESCLLPSYEVAEPLAKFPAMVPASDAVKCDACPECPPTPSANCTESDHDSFYSPNDMMSLDKTAANACALIAISSMNAETLPPSPVHQPRRSVLVQRRIRRPFSVSEVDALVQAVETFGTGRWRDIKIQAFDNSKHRTYVDLKDKWKTLVHTAQISPQQRRGERVPQELLDRVLAAHNYWSQPQAKVQVKSPVAEACKESRRREIIGQVEKVTRQG